jgi:PleD family two-component response regulator
MAHDNPTLLVVEDDLDVCEMLNAYFHIQGYDVMVVNWGGDVLPACQARKPDLVILDIRLPDIDGYEVARLLRGNRRTNDIPIIFLTDKRGRADRLRGLSLGADDYVTKPFDVQELRLRVRNALKRARQGGLLNPVTGLPEGSVVEEKLKECLGSGGWSFLSVAIQHLDDFRDEYGFVASDDALRAISLMVTNTVRDLGEADDFVGHLSQTVLVVATRGAGFDALKEKIKTRLEQSLDYFYPLKSRNPETRGENRLSIKLAEAGGSDTQLSDLLYNLAGQSSR